MQNGIFEKYRGQETDSWLKKKGVQEAKQYLELVSTFDIFLPNESSDQWKFSILRAKERWHPCLLSINNFDRSLHSAVIKSNPYLQPEKCLSKYIFKKLKFNSSAVCIVGMSITGNLSLPFH